MIEESFSVFLSPLDRDFKVVEAEDDALPRLLQSSDLIGEGGQTVAQRIAGFDRLGVHGQLFQHSLEETRHGVELPFLKIQEQEPVARIIEPPRAGLHQVVEQR